MTHAGTLPSTKFNPARVAARYGPLVPIVLMNNRRTHLVTAKQAELIEQARSRRHASYGEMASAVGLDRSTIHRDTQTLTGLGVLRAITTGVGRYARTSWKVAADVVIRARRMVPLGELIARALAVNVASSATERDYLERERRDGDATFDGELPEVTVPEDEQPPPAYPPRLPEADRHPAWEKLGKEWGRL